MFKIVVMSEILLVLSAIVIIGTGVPYLADILKGRVRPLRSTRIMFLCLLVLALLQQSSIARGPVLVVTVSELFTAALLGAVAIFKGEGGVSRIDMMCYLLLIGSVTAWMTTGNALIGLLFTIIADFVAFFPVLYRLVKNTSAETPLYYWGGVVGPILGILADENKSLPNIVFAAYLVAINVATILIITKGKRDAKNTGVK